MFNAIEAVDFNALYGLQKQASTHRKKDCDAWNKKAKEMNKNIHSGDYNETIEAWINIAPHETLLDVGCGPGTFSLRFAPKVKAVHAFDFSASMLESLEENVKAQKLENIHAFEADIEGDWVSVPVCDVVLASRCLEVDDLQAALGYLHAHARKAVYVSFKVGKSYLKEALLEAIGREITPKPDYIYLVNILYRMGIHANVSFFSPKESCCGNATSEEEYIQSIAWSLDGITAQEEARARALYAQCLKEGTPPPLRDSRWALIWWEK